MTDLRKALERAFCLGQTYWQQADSESIKQNAKSNVTLEKFRTFVDETCAALSAPALPEPAVKAGWRPIETAPTHGHILLFWKHASVCVGFWGIDDKFDRRPKKWPCPEAGWQGEADQCIPRNQEDCTHWMPLPPAPEIAETGAAEANVPGWRGEVVVTTTPEGECVLVSRQDEEGRILSVIWEKA